ncbi:hypothetical protein OJ997_02795 [Solirubrobacter phytolaccae]|uniref:Uncharacterized protein n=1 Tax=Solirubrobacter phytolaccae TaxID=1404360 RepID=A0A9X3S7J0_9ACTN|nr:hypothetical protein [Solirubrobacter phytolaccae]MDA0179211.1 hypothetical protein [Solirubrobacter phytolaccae]
MTWEELIAEPRRRDEHGVLVVLEEVDHDTRTAVFRRAGESFTVRADKVTSPSDFKPAPEFALEVKVLTGEIVDEDAERSPAGSGRARVVAAGVAAAGLALLAARRRR